MDRMEDQDRTARPDKPPRALNSEPVMAERAKTRSVLAISGPKSLSFLNSLTTNELNQLRHDATCLHTFFLNAKGRIIHEALVYSPDEGDDDGTIFVECDISSLQALQTHLIMYRTKTNIEIRSVEQDVAVWTVFDPKEIDTFGDESAGGEKKSHNTSFLDNVDLGSDVLSSRDPRMWPLGVRILAPKDMDVSATLRGAGVKISSSDQTGGNYRMVRYKLGVAEGVAEIGYGRSLPAEINGDYTNAISQAKSGYVGWTADGFKATITRRMLPLRFQGTGAQYAAHLTPNAPITDRKGKKRAPIGYLRGIQLPVGLGLMHIPSVLVDTHCTVGKMATECMRPPWWKPDARKPAIVAQEMSR
ncbi:Aminomethyltransferase folate-Hypothetical protein domain [Nesidiocoris tenuis]|nr:Aminomethyltransferase folate-Hypothetical protein domain [Nesidiocoris tenuis]